MAENLQDLQEVMKDEVPNLRELTVNRICDLLDKETESDKILARDMARPLRTLKTCNIMLHWLPPATHTAGPI